MKILHSIVRFYYLQGSTAGEDVLGEIMTTKKMNNGTDSRQVNAIASGAGRVTETADAPKADARISDTLEKSTDHAAFFDSARIESDKELLKQKELIEERISKRADGISKVAEGLMERERSTITNIELKKLSVENVKLFAEINAYKNFILKAEESIANNNPDPKSEIRINSESVVENLLEYLDATGVKANSVLENLGKSKQVGTRRIPMLMQEVENLQTGMYSAGKDDNLLFRLGSNVLKCENGDSSRNMIASIDEDILKIKERLDPKSKVFLYRFSDFESLSDQIIMSIAVINTQPYVYKAYNGDSEWPVSFVAAEPDKKAIEENSAGNSAVELEEEAVPQHAPVEQNAGPELKEVQRKDETVRTNETAGKPKRSRLWKEISIPVVFDTKK